MRGNEQVEASGDAPINLELPIPMRGNEQLEAGGLVKGKAQVTDPHEG